MKENQLDWNEDGTPDPGPTCYCPKCREEGFISHKNFRGPYPDTIVYECGTCGFKQEKPTLT